jgi:hypothetical protein
MIFHDAVFQLKSSAVWTINASPTNGDMAALAFFGQETLFSPERRGLVCDRGSALRLSWVAGTAALLFGVHPW